MSIGMSAEGGGAAGGVSGGFGDVTTTAPGTTGRAAVVTETGIALVHEGEFIYPSPGGEAEVALAEVDSRLAVTVHLPVLVEMVGGAADVDAAVDETLRRLRAAVEAHNELG